MTKPDVLSMVQMEAKMLMSAYGLVANTLVCMAKTKDEEIITQTLNGMVLQFVSDIGLGTVEDDMLVIAPDFKSCAEVVDEKVRVVHTIIILFFKPFLQQATLDEFTRQVELLGVDQKERLADLMGEDLGDTRSFN